MNFFNDDEKLKETFGIKRGQLPKTRFIDNINAVKVKLINWPDEERIKRHLIQFATGSWFEDFSKYATEDDYNSALEELQEGRILAQGLEGVQFSFLVSGLSLHGSHAIVRTRIGAAYLQQSQAVCDLRHSDILVPRAYQKHADMLNEYKKIAISCKHLYAALLETNDIAVTDARFSLLKTIPVWVNISMSLPTILGVYSKRTDVTEEHPEMNVFAELLRLRIEEKFPWMNTYFKRDNNCIHRFEGYRSNCVFKRAGNDVLPPDAKENWHFHDKTKHELMLDGLHLIEDEYYISYTKVTKDEYDEY
jgi:thymidylate synthase ThyX